MEKLLQDLRYAIRLIFKSPGVSLVVMLALALSIGANTAIFSVVNAIVLHSLPYPEADRLAMVWQNNRRIGLDQDLASYPNYIDWRDQSQVFEQMAAFAPVSITLTGVDEPERVQGALITPNFFQVMGVQPIQGRAFLEEEQVLGRHNVVIISQGLWERRFGSAPDIIGQQITLDGIGRTVVGVMPAGFSFPKDVDIWPVLPSNNDKRSQFFLRVIGRLKPDVTVKQAQIEMNTIASRIEQQYPELAGYGVNIVSLHNQVVGGTRPALMILFGAVVFLLLIACANIANLLLARSAARAKEIAVRAGLGAKRKRLIRQLLTESVLLSAAGGLIGLLMAFWGVSLFVSISPGDLPRLNEIAVDARVLAFTFVISVGTGILFGLFPALHASKPNLSEMLKEAGRSSTGGIRGNRIRNTLVLAEIALAMVLLVGAGLMIKSFMQLQKTNVGFTTDNILTMRLQLPSSKYSERSQSAGFYQRLIQRVEAQPGVRGAAVISSIFLSKTANSSAFTIEGRPPFRPEESVEVPFDAVSAGYFQVMGIPLLKGREFTEFDADGAPRAVIINETMARRFWSDEDPIGKRFKFGTAESDAPWRTIVGVVADVRRTGYDSAVRPEVYVHHPQVPMGAMMLVVRAASAPDNLASTVRSQVQALDKDLPVYNIKTMDQLLGEMVAQRRFYMILLSIFAVVAVILASVGVYSVMAYSVTRRTHEIGIRMALGARPRDVIGIFFKQGVKLSVTGVIIGTAGAFILTRLMRSLLYQVSPTDPLIFLGVAVFLGALVLIAGYIPARHATEVDPTVALRKE